METFKPGLFHIGLNTGKKVTNRYFFIQNKILNNKLKMEPIYIKPAIYNIQALFFFCMDAGRTTARLILEKLIADNPKDLNALADLIYVYKEMGLEGDSDKYKTQLESYKEDTLSQAKGILGQALLLTYDLPDDQSKSPRVLLKDAWRQLNAKSQHTEQISKANKLIIEAYKVVKEIPEPPYEKAIDEIKMTVEKFEEGIKMLENMKCSPEEIWVWKYNLAFARNRLNMHRYRKGDERKRAENLRKSHETHLNMIKNHPPIENLQKHMDIYVAKSYIYFVQGLRMENAERGQDTDSMLKKAISICPKQHNIWRIYGQYLKNIQNYLEAIDAFSKSISLLPDPHINWLAYEGRRDTYYFYSLQLIKTKSDENEINHNLKLSYNDGNVCMQSRRTHICMLRMAYICFELAKPDLHLFKCQQIYFIYEALDIIHEALNKWDISKNVKFYNLLGKCCLVIGEYRKSIESLKTVLELNKWSENFPGVFKMLSKCFLAFYEREKDTNLLTEFRFILKEASKRCLDEWVTDAMQMILEKSAEIMIALVENMIKYDAKGCKMLIEEALQHQECKMQLESFKNKLEEKDNEETEKNGPNEIQESKRSDNCQCDFFVSHSEKDKDWVNNMLRPQLEEYDDEIKFKGCIQSRDFAPGERVFESICSGIKDCRKLVILLTPNYLENNWKRYMNDECLSQAIERKVEEKTIIPIVLKRCSIPDELKPLNPIDFTEKNDWDEVRMSLIINMD